MKLLFMKKLLMAVLILTGIGLIGCATDGKDRYHNNNSGGGHGHH